MHWAMVVAKDASHHGWGETRDGIKLPRPHLLTKIHQPNKNMLKNYVL
jgi:hypothetical protein